jgi:hypothetical protein
MSIEVGTHIVVLVVSVKLSSSFVGLVSRYVRGGNRMTAERLSLMRLPGPLAVLSNKADFTVRVGACLAVQLCRLI